MKTMAEVLAGHREIAWNHQTGQAICADCDADLGPLTADIEVQDQWFLEHQAAALFAAGFGPVREAAAEALRGAAKELEWHPGTQAWLRARANVVAGQTMSRSVPYPDYRRPTTQAREPECVTVKNPPKSTK